MKNHRTPNWDKWRHIRNVTLGQVVALSLDIDPDKVSINDESQDFKNRLDIVCSNLGHHSGLVPTSINMGSPHLAQIQLSPFHFFAEAVDWSLPEEFPRDGRSEQLAHVYKWPWGNHSTKLLDHLAAAADKFWKLYDPGDPTTAPTNHQVTLWLQEQGVASRVAQIIAQILRANGLPTGPRK